MSLNTRSRSYEFAEYEKELLFHRQNTGLVQYISKDGRLFSLNPSPYYKGDQNLHFFAESCDPPPNNKFVTVEVCYEDITYLQNQDGWYKDILRKISGWNCIDLEQIVQRRKLIEYDQIIQFFSNFFRGDDDILDRVASCTAIFSFSSPPITDEVGGINAAILAKKPQWEAIKKPIKIIPKEFFRPNSKVFYRISEKEEYPCEIKSNEINLAFLNPERLLTDIPIVLDNLAIRKIDGLQQGDNDDKQKFITSYLLDSLMLNLDSMESIEKQVTNAVYEIRDEYLRSGISPYRQNLGDAIPKLTASIARLHLDKKPKPDHVKKVLELWKEMHRKVKYRMGDALPISKYYDFSDNARKLYTELYDTFGKEFVIPMQDVLTITSLKNDSDFNHALNELVERGFAIRDKRGIRLLEKWR